MNQSRYVTSSSNELPPTSLQIMPHKTVMSTLRADASYLLTGGSGGLSASFAKWLAEHGAKYIILTSRSGIVNADTTKIIETFQAKGVVILPFKCDVTNPDQVNELAGTELNHIPPIRGVIHGAFIDKVSAFPAFLSFRINLHLAARQQLTFSRASSSKKAPSQTTTPSSVPKSMAPGTCTTPYFTIPSTSSFPWRP